MPKDDRMPHTQTSAPVKPPEETQDPARRGAPEERAPSREAGEGERGGRMPKGADEPGAGM